MVAAEGLGCGKSIGVSKCDGSGSGAAHRYAGDGDAVLVDGKEVLCPVEDLHHVDLAELAVHRVAERIGGDDEPFDRIDIPWVAVFPFGVATLVVATEKPAHHRERLAVHPVQDHDQGIGLVGGARQTNDGGTYTAKRRQLSVERRSVGKATNARVRSQRIAAGLEIGGIVGDRSRVGGERVAVRVADIDELGESVAKMLERGARHRGIDEKAAIVRGEGERAFGDRHAFGA